VITENIKYRTLSKLSDKYMTKTELTWLVRSRGSEYRKVYFDWLEDKVSQKYRVNDRGPASEVYSLSVAGVNELERLKVLFEM